MPERSRNTGETERVLRAGQYGSLGALSKENQE
jgi:hypothetical protein